MVLGLTMAEIMILVIFILLLTLSAFLERQEQAIEELEGRVAERDEELGELNEWVDAIEEVMAGAREIPDLTRELVLAQGEVERLNQDVAALTEKHSALEEEKRSLQAERDRLAEENQNYAAIEQALAARGASTAEEVAKIFEAAERLNDLESALAEGGFDTEDLPRLDEQLAAAAAAAAALSQLGDENTTLRDPMAYFKRIVGGRSNLIPPCWINPVTRKSEYIFDVALTSNGIVIHDNKLPHRREEQAELPIQRIPFESALSAGRFLAATRALFDWSEAQDCRFYVRIFDSTAENEKVLYKRLLRAVEGPFYKLLMSDARGRP
jgi:predicted  nucleic acid-binding Zn-ribbon protein